MPRSGGQTPKLNISKFKQRSPKRLAKFGVFEFAFKMPGWWFPFRPITCKLKKNRIAKYNFLVNTGPYTVSVFHCSVFIYFVFVFLTFFLLFWCAVFFTCYFFFCLFGFTHRTDFFFFFSCGFFFSLFSTFCISTFATFFPFFLITFFTPLCCFA